MKFLAFFLLFVALVTCFSGCAAVPAADIAATTLPVYEFTAALCQGTDLTVTRLVTENVSCLHDYTLRVEQMKAIRGAKAVVISGAGLEEFMEDALNGVPCVIDASAGLALAEGHHHEDSHDHSHGHSHADDPHIWLSPANAAHMAENICHALCDLYPHREAVFQENLAQLLQQLSQLQSYGEEALSSLSCRELITFHDGFAYFAESFGLHILEAVEEEAGSEASAARLKDLCGLIREHRLPAVFTERSASTSAAQIIAAETGIRYFALDMAMSGNSYFDAMYHNIDTVREALQ